MFYELMKHAVLGPPLRVLYHPTVEGLENIPAEGPAILASNHLAVIDSFFLPLMLPREVVFLGKSDYVEGSGIKGRFIAWFMRGVGLIPVDRSGGKADFGVPKEKVYPLLHLTVPTYKPEECPLCKAGVPITERGSHHLK